MNSGGICGVSSEASIAGGRGNGEAGTLRSTERSPKVGVEALVSSFCQFHFFNHDPSSHMIVMLHAKGTGQ
jgi:hypothetical protein